MSLVTIPICANISQPLTRVSLTAFVDGLYGNDATAFITSPVFKYQTIEKATADIMQYYHDNPRKFRTWTVSISPGTYKKLILVNVGNIIYKGADKKTTFIAGLDISDTNGLRYTLGFNNLHISPDFITPISTLISLSKVNINFRDVYVNSTETVSTVIFGSNAFMSMVSCDIVGQLTSSLDSPARVIYFTGSELGRSRLECSYNAFVVNVYGTGLATGSDLVDASLIVTDDDTYIRMFSNNYYVNIESKLNNGFAGIVKLPSIALVSFVEDVNFYNNEVFEYDDYGGNAITHMLMYQNVFKSQISHCIAIVHRDNNVALGGTIQFAANLSGGNSTFNNNYLTLSSFAFTSLSPDTVKESVGSGTVATGLGNVVLLPVHYTTTIPSINWSPNVYGVQLTPLGTIASTGAYSGNVTTYTTDSVISSRDGTNVVLISSTGEISLTLPIANLSAGRILKFALANITGSALITSSPTDMIIDNGAFVTSLILATLSLTTVELVSDGLHSWVIIAT
jgi:hypothetical protein